MLFAPEQQENETINQSLIQHAIKHRTKNKNCMFLTCHKDKKDTAFSFPFLFSLWWWPPSQRDHKQRAERFQTDGREEGEQMNAQKNNTSRGVWKPQWRVPVRIGGRLRHEEKVFWGTINWGVYWRDDGNRKSKQFTLWKMPGVAAWFVQHRDKVEESIKVTK